MPSRVKPVRALPAKILLVDSHRAGARARCTVLEEQGHRATCVVTPEDALVLLQTETFQVIVTEYKLAGTTGPEFILKLREVAQDTPVILLSGFVDVLGLNEQSTGADVVLMKSASETSQLTYAVTRLLRKKPTLRRPRKKPIVSDTESLIKTTIRTGTHE